MQMNRNYWLWSFDNPRYIFFTDALAKYNRTQINTEHNTHKDIISFGIDIKDINSERTRVIAITCVNSWINIKKTTLRIPAFLNAEWRTNFSDKVGSQDWVPKLDSVNPNIILSLLFTECWTRIEDRSFGTRPKKWHD